LQFVHFSAGYAFMGALMGGRVTLKQAVVTLLVGSMAVITMIYVKYSLLMYLALFGKFGAKHGLVSSLFSTVAKAVMTFLALTMIQTCRIMAVTQSTIFLDYCRRSSIN